jgi:hypothetical protein
MQKKLSSILTILVSSFISFGLIAGLTGCANPTPKNDVVYVPQKCTPDYTEPPVMDNKFYVKAKDIVAKAIINYQNQQAYTQEILIKQKKCQ